MESISSIDRDLSPEEMDILQKVGHLTGLLSKLMLGLIREGAFLSSWVFFSVVFIDGQTSVFC